MLPSPPGPATSRHRPPSPTVSVVIPVRDGSGLPLVLRALPPVDEVIVVTDDPAGQAARATRPDAVLVRPPRPGPGAALAGGVAAARGDIVVTLNGDGSTDPNEIPNFVGALLAGADVALGSRYLPGGRDLTGGRLRNWANQVLIFLITTLTGVRRTDPGFGYAAFWRDAADRMGLPDASPRAPAAWGDGPEIGPLLILHPAATGLTVTEIAGVAYPRMRRAPRTDPTRLRHWLRVALRERNARPARHATSSSGTPADRDLLPAGVPMGTGAPLSAHPTLRPESPSAARTEAGAATPWTSTRSGAAQPWTNPRSGAASPWTSTRSGNSSPWRAARTNNSPAPAGEPVAGESAGWPFARQRSPEPERGPVPAAPAVPPGRQGEFRPAWDVPTSATPHREVGARRRRLQPFRQQRPDLRVINGEGTGSSLSRSGRLRSVPHPENDS